MRTVTRALLAAVFCALLTGCAAVAIRSGSPPAAATASPTPVPATPSAGLQARVGGTGLVVIVLGLAIADGIAYLRDKLFGPQQEVRGRADCAERCPGFAAER